MIHSTLLFPVICPHLSWVCCYENANESIVFSM